MNVSKQASKLYHTPHNWTKTWRVSFGTEVARYVARHGEDFGQKK